MSASVKHAVCDIEASNPSSVHMCQEMCRKCKNCRFFQYYKYESDHANFCDVFETSKEEVRGKALGDSNSGVYQSPAGDTYQFVYNGPEVCGKPIFS